jgi:NADH-quinone oxidoreductase subunit L
MIISTIVGVSGIVMAWLIYYKKTFSADQLAERFKPIYTLLYNKYYFDELYDLIIVRPILAFGRFMWSFDAHVIDGLVNGAAWLTMVWSDIKMWFDKWIIDGAVNGAGWVVSQASAGLRFIQNGIVQFYVLFIAIVIVVIGWFKFESVHIDFDWPMLTTVIIAGLIALYLMTRWTQARERSSDQEAGTGDREQ